MTAKTITRKNGLDLEALGQLVNEIKTDATKGFARFKVASSWKGQTRSEARVESYVINGKEIPRRFSIVADEPPELLGQNSAPNPQELLMAAFNACVMVGYVATSAVMGINLDSVEIETEGELDLRGFLGIDSSVPTGYEKLSYVVRIKGSGTKEEFAKVHEAVMATSPNFYNLSRSVALEPTLLVE